MYSVILAAALTAGGVASDGVADRRFVGSNRSHHAVVVPVTAAARPRRDHAKRESHQRPHVDAGSETKIDAREASEN